MSPRSASIVSSGTGRRGSTGVSTGAGSRRTPRRISEAARLLVLAAALAIGGSVQAATVNAVQGQVLVNAGQGYRLVDGSTQVEAGGSVVANPGAVAHVLYPGGCQVTVEPGSVYLIAAQSPCQTGAKTHAGGLGGTSDDKSTPPSSSASSGVNPWLLGGAALAVGGGVAYGVMSISP
jgi:hypothetical protein